MHVVEAKLLDERKKAHKATSFFQFHFVRIHKVLLLALDILYTSHLSLAHFFAGDLAQHPKGRICANVTCQPGRLSSFFELTSID